MFIKRWDGFCFDGQQNTGTKISGKTTPEECEKRCLGQDSCIAFVSHPSNICYITSDHEAISKWTTSSHLQYSCNEKIIATKYERQWKGLCYDGQQSKAYTPRVTPKQCQNKCSGETSCIGFASHPNNLCILTFKDETLSQWTAQNYLAYTCYKKI